MDTIVTTTDGVPCDDVGPTFCRYCGAALYPQFYFCLTCATPYKSSDTVLPVMVPRRLTTGELVDRSAPNVKPLFWSYFTVCAVTGVFSYLMFAGDFVAPALVLQALAFAVTTLVFAIRHWRSLKAQLTKLGFGRPAAYCALAGLGPLLLLNYAHIRMLEALLPSYEHVGARLSEIGLDYSAMVVLFCVLPAIIEEIAFRGLLQHWLQIAVRPLMALVLASALFSLLHLSILSFPYLFLAGMLMGWAKWKTGSLYPSMLIHFLHNFVVVTFWW